VLLRGVVQNRIIERGSHDELMALDGFYAGLYNSQFENAA